MFSRARLRFIIFFLTAALILTIHLRTSASRLFHRARLAQVQQNQMTQQLWKKQLELESLTQPQAVMKHLSEEPVSEEPTP
jgi:hypothetical protein